MAHWSFLIVNYRYLTIFGFYLCISNVIMSAVYEINLTEEQKAQFISKIERKVDRTNFCHFWLGSLNESGYGVFRPVINSKQHKVLVHRFYFFIQGHHIDKNLHVSHLCHCKICINTQHLSIEPQSVNNSWKTCKSLRRCMGHEPYPQCLFP